MNRFESYLEEKIDNWQLDTTVYLGEDAEDVVYVGASSYGDFDWVLIDNVYEDKEEFLFLYGIPSGFDGDATSYCFDNDTAIWFETLKEAVAYIRSNFTPDFDPEAQDA